jgi:hypothetical protein
VLQTSAGNTVPENRLTGTTGRSAAGSVGRRFFLLAESVRPEENRSYTGMSIKIVFFGAVSHVSGCEWPAEARKS